MSQRYYLDSCIWRDYLENRSDRFRPLGEWALMLITKIIEHEELFIFSPLVLQELEKYISREILTERFSIIPLDLRIYILVSKADWIEAFKAQHQLKTPVVDTLHALLARKYNAILITRDAHFEELQKIATIAKPEDLL